MRVPSGDAVGACRKNDDILLHDRASAIVLEQPTTRSALNQKLKWEAKNTRILIKYIR